jgi:hypothetical protein
MPSHLGSESWTWKAAGHAGDYPIYFAIDPVGGGKKRGPTLPKKRRPTLVNALKGVIEAWAVQVGDYPKTFDFPRGACRPLRETAPASLALAQ